MLIVIPKDEAFLDIPADKADTFDKLSMISKLSSHSRNELINVLLEHAIENVEVE